jgi:hypothetical protein
MRGCLFDLGFAKLDVFFRNRVVFSLHQFVGHGARILPRDIEKPGIRAGYKLHLDGRGLRHGKPRMLKGRETSLPPVKVKKRA